MSVVVFVTTMKLSNTCFSIVMFHILFGELFTIGNRHFAECRRLCRVYFIIHSAKMVFAECQIKYTRQKKTLDKMRLCRVPFFWHSTKMYFAECHFSALGKMRLCRVPFLTIGKEAFCCVHFFSPRQIIFSKQFLRP